MYQFTTYTEAILTPQPLGSSIIYEGLIYRIYNCWGEAMVLLVLLLLTRGEGMFSVFSLGKGVMVSSLSLSSPPPSHSLFHSLTLSLTLSLFSRNTLMTSLLSCKFYTSSISQPLPDWMNFHYILIFSCPYGINTMRALYVLYSIHYHIILASRFTNQGENTDVEIQILQVSLVSLKINNIYCLLRYHFCV